MQKIACADFAGQQGRIIGREFYEKGVSGFKVSANWTFYIRKNKRTYTSSFSDMLYSPVN